MKTAVVLVNLGTPDEPTPKAVRRYLRSFLSDPRVVEAPRILWWGVLNAFILPFRPRRVAKAYQTIWSPEGSPLRVISKKQEKKLQQKLQHEGHGQVVVKSAMTYGNPNLIPLLLELAEQRVQKVIFLPLFPQYSGSTTAAVFDLITKHYQRQRDIPEQVFIRDYHQASGYIKALAKSVEAHWEKQGRAEKLLMSFHGIPQEYVDKGDPYQSECVATANALAERLGLKEGEWEYSFQSRFGPKAWIKPYTDELLSAWPNQGVRSVDVICPGFSVDCLETIEEIAEENKETFIEAGGSAYHYIASLNDSEGHINMMHDLVKAYL